MDTNREALNFRKFLAQCRGMLEKKVKKKEISLSQKEINTLISPSYSGDNFEYDKRIWEKLPEKIKGEIIDTWKNRAKL